jgi:peptide/nickel transport system substrate-binding protein
MDRSRHRRWVGALCLALAIVAAWAVHDALSRRAMPEVIHLGRAAVNPWTVHGVLRIASQQRPDTLGPMLGEQYIDDDLSMLWAGYLLSWSDRSDYLPDLATEVPTQANGGISSDGLTVTYHLRKGVVWQDGAPFTSADVAFSWRAVMNPKDIISSRVGYTDVRSVDAPDPFTAVVHLKRRFAPFIGTFFAMSAEPVPLMPEHLLAKYPSLVGIPYNLTPVGTGPFSVASDRDGKIRFVANDRYWRGPPRLKEIDFQWLPDDAALVTALKAHSIDLYMEGAQALEPELQGNRGFTVYLYPFTRFMDIGLNTASPPLSDVRVRQALDYATNRRRFIDQISDGVNLPADTDQPAFGWAHYDGVKKYPYDPRLAAMLLEGAGWRRGLDGIRYKDGKPLHLLLVGEQGSDTKEDAAEEIRREWRAVGVAVTIKNYSSDTLYAPKQLGGIQQNERFDVTFEEWGYGVDPDDSQVFMCEMRPPVGWNIYNYCDPALEAAERVALGHFDRATRKRAYARIQSIVARDVPMIPVWFDQMQDVANIDLENYKPTHAGSSFWNSWEWSI